MSSPAVDAVISGMSADLQRCYTQGQRDDPHMRGRMQVRVKVGADGAVTTADVTQSVGLSEYVVRCVLERVRTARFPAPEGGHDTVIIPAVFEPKP